MKKTAIFLFSLLSLSACHEVRTADEDLTRYVDQYIGTGGHGHVFMGANVPFGFVQLGPTSIPQSWDWVSGYHITDTTVIGFSHTHLNGTGIGDLSDISLMPVTGDVTLARGTEDDPQSGMWSYFSRCNEAAEPGYYRTRLDRYDIGVELTATARVGFHKYTFPASDEPRVVIDLENGTCWDAPTETYIERENDTVVSGYRFSKGWANDQRIYFTAVFSKPIEQFLVYDMKSPLRPAGSLKAERTYGVACFAPTAAGEELYVKVALSPVSVDNARLNMQAELPAWDFPATAAQAKAAWNAELDKIHIRTADESVKRIFYTALYHTMVAPSVFCDVNGDYRGADGKTYTDGGFVNYTTFSLWDTYRAAMPLMTIIHPEKMNDMVNTMLHIYKQQGKLPVWHLMGCETDCMVGNPGIPPVADAILKGYDGFDKALAFEAMKASALRPDRGQDLRMKYGYIPSDLFNESVAYDMEYAIADWALAQAARYLAENETDEAKAAEYREAYRHFDERSHSYRHFFDRATGFMRGKRSDGKFRTPFSPFASTHREDDYCEGNGWQYTWLVPHDLEGLVGCFGSEEALLSKLDSLFVVQSDLEGENASPDISGLIGQYAHGNEPSHHVLYMYPYFGQPWKTAEKVRRVLGELYHDQPDGLSGNEDVGQMSAWYILSAMGLYQMEPAGGRYVFGSPIVDEAVIRVGDGKELVIRAENNSAENIYIQSVTLNGRPHNQYYIDYADIRQGGELKFVMGSSPVNYYSHE